MRLIINETAAWICVLLGAGIQTAALAWHLKKQNRLKAARAWTLAALRPIRAPISLYPLPVARPIRIALSSAAVYFVPVGFAGRC